MKKGFLTFVCFVFFVVPVFAATTIDPAHPYSYGANIGWMNAYADGTNGAVVGPYFCSGYLYGANVGWIHIGSGPEDGVEYSNDSAADFGINHDGAGNLRGYAYGANIGWINFEPTGSPTVDLETGELSGYAWGANVGWINLSTLATLSIDFGPDSDTDGIPDVWERYTVGTLSPLGGNGADADHDGVSDVDEYASDTGPLDGTDYLRITDFQALETTNWVTWTCKPTRLYTLQYAAALSNSTTWADTGASFVPPSGPDVAEMVTGVNDTSRFYRVRVELPLSP